MNWQALQDRTNTAVIAAFGEAVVLDGSTVRGVFDTMPATFDGVAGSAPIFQLASASVPADPRGLALVIGADSYTVREYTHDGSGLCTLKLEAV